MVARCLSPKLANEYSTTLTLESRQRLEGDGSVLLSWQYMEVFVA